MMETQDNKPTCLHSRHVGLGALMSPFGRIPHAYTV